MTKLLLTTIVLVSFFTNIHIEAANLQRWMSSEGDNGHIEPRTTEGLLSSADFNGDLSITESGEIRVKERGSIESNHPFSRPITVEAEIKSESSSECMSMTLFAQDDWKHGGIAIEMGMFGTQWGFWNGDYNRTSSGPLEKRGDTGSVIDWRKVKLELDANDGVKCYIDGNEVFATTSTKSEGTLRFVAPCRTMLIRNIMTSGSAEDDSCDDDVDWCKEINKDDDCCSQFVKSHCSDTCGICSETCVDGLKNQDETDVDCGGVCPACETCVDGLKNQDETDVDCGGVCSACEWQMYPNFCVSATNVDLPQTNYPSGDANIDACKSGCIDNSKCSAIEWYSSGWGGSKCKLMLSDVPASKGSPGGRWQDAACYVKEDTVAVLTGDGGYDGCGFDCSQCCGCGSNKSWRGNTCCSGCYEGKDQNPNRKTTGLDTCDPTTGLNPLDHRYGCVCYAPTWDAGDAYNANTFGVCEPGQYCHPEKASFCNDTPPGL